MKKIKLLVCACLFAGVTHATVYYVSPEGDNTDGLSWETAFNSPKDALAKTTSGNHEVWVKQGTYVSATHMEWKPGVCFYGGFTGTETEKEQRNPDPSLTILEGTRENRIMTAPQTAYTTIWDGFTIQKGKSSGGGGGVMLQRNAVLQNCIVQDNEATHYGGGGIIVQDANADDKPVKIINCIIRNNTFTPSADPRNGGGILVKEDCSNVLISHCIIEGNTAITTSHNTTGGGIAIYAGTVENTFITNNRVIKEGGSNCNGGGVWAYVRNDNITFRNCVISNNYANAGNGGGVFVAGMSGYTGEAVFTNCHVVNNEISYASYGGGGVFYQIPARLTNCILWGNIAPGSTVNNLRTPNEENIIRNCAFDNRANSITWGIATENTLMLETDNTGSEEGKLYPFFAHPTSFTGIAVTEEEKAELAAANWSLQENSACINAGTAVDLDVDILGTERPQDGLYDIGAYEFKEEIHTGICDSSNDSGILIYPGTGNIVVDYAGGATAFVYTLTGSLLREVFLVQGVNVIPVPAGVYLIKVNHTIGKVCVK